MGRKSLRDERRQQIMDAFTLVLADHGYAGSTMLAIAEKAGLSPGLLHHYYSDKSEMLNELLNDLLKGFRLRIKGIQKTSSLENYLEAALGLNERSDTIRAKCWVAILAEAIREPTLLASIKRYLDKEIVEISRMSEERLDQSGSCALLAYIFGSLILGAFTPKRVAGFAAPNGKKFLDVLQNKDLKT